MFLIVKLLIILFLDIDFVINVILLNLLVLKKLLDFKWLLCVLFLVLIEFGIIVVVVFKVLKLLIFFLIVILNWSNEFFILEIIKCLIWNFKLLCVLLKVKLVII